MQAIAHPRVWMFFGLAAGLSWLGLSLPPWFMDSGFFVPLLQVALFSWGPALAAVVMRRYVYQKGLRGLGWNRKHFDLKWIATTIFAPFGILAATIGLVFLLGNVLGLPGFGEVDIAAQSADWRYLGSWDYLSDSVRQMMLPLFGQADGEFWQTVLLLSAILTIVGATVGMFVQLGSEMGFRGYLLRELQPLGFLGSNTIIGLLAGAWQLLPLFYFAPGGDITVFGWAALVPLGYQLSLAFPLAWLSLKARSVYAAATFSSVLGQVGSLSMLFLWNSDPTLAGVDGMAGMLVLMLATLGILIWDKPFVENYPRLVY